MYRYLECGLDDVWLIDGYRRMRTSYGAGVAIADVDGLHKAIAARTTHLPGALRPQEFRFLRKHLGLSQSGLGELIGADTQAIARWEKGKSAIPGAADRLLRALCEQHAQGDANVMAIVERLKKTDSADRVAARFKHSKCRWRAAA
jgi:putative transcriptional regulator